MVGVSLQLGHKKKQLHKKLRRKKSFWVVRGILSYPRLNETTGKGIHHSFISFRKGVILNFCFLKIGIFNSPYKRKGPLYVKSSLSDFFQYFLDVLRLSFCTKSPRYRFPEIGDMNVIL